MAVQAEKIAHRRRLSDMGASRRAAVAPEKSLRPRAYIMPVGQPTMAINAARNRRCGPGGSSRRLHHSPLVGLYGGESGSTRVVKALIFARHDTAVIGPSFKCQRQPHGSRCLTLRQARSGGDRATEAPRISSPSGQARSGGHRAPEAPQPCTGNTARTRFEVSPAGAAREPQEPDARSALDYGRLVERALRPVVREALEVVAKRGLPGRHHLYITFRTDHPEVVIDDGCARATRPR